MFTTPIIYIEVHRGHIFARRLGDSGNVRKESAALNHPRTLMGDFVAIQLLFRNTIEKLAPGGFLRRKPKIVVHLVPDAGGGYTDVEQRAFIEAAVSSGAKACSVLVGNQPLSDHQVIQALA